MESMDETQYPVSKEDKLSWYNNNFIKESWLTLQTVTLYCIYSKDTGIELDYCKIIIIHKRTMRFVSQ